MFVQPLLLLKRASLQKFSNKFMFRLNNGAQVHRQYGVSENISYSARTTLIFLQSAFLWKK